MRTIRQLYADFRGLIHEAARFSVVGFSGLVLTDVGANLLHYHAQMGRLSSVAIASTVSIALAFLGCRYWTYRHRERPGAGRETLLFFAMNAVGIGITEGCVGLTFPLHRSDGLSYNIALNGGNALAALFRYYSYKKWVWPRAGIPAPQSAVSQRTARRTAVSWTAAGQVAVPGKFSLLRSELATFGVVGACAFLITAAGTYVLNVRAAVGPVLAGIIAVSLATTLSYLGHHYWTVRHRQPVRQGSAGVLYYLLNGAALAIMLSCLGFTTYVLDMRGNTSIDLGLAIGISFGTVFRFWSYRKWVWPTLSPAS
jgi:putative flippase GtrA